MNGTQVFFDGIPLQTANIIISRIEHESIPTKDASAFKIAHGNQSVIPYIDYPSKNITISGTLIGNSIANLNGLVDVFKGYFNGQGKYLDIGYISDQSVSSDYRRYIVTMNSLSISRPNGLMYANFEIGFIALRPFGQDVLPTTIINASGRTGASYSDSVTFTGSSPYQFPILTITYTAVGDSSLKTVNFGNNANGQQISVTRVWLPNDVFAVDVFKKDVTVNGNPVDYSGAFPEFVPGANSAFYGDSFSSRTFNHNLVYYRAWL